MNFWERNDYNEQSATYNTANNNRNGGSQNGFQNNSAEGFAQKGNNQAEAEMREKVEQYSHKSEDQLVSELAATVARMKNDGTFDASAMENLFNTAAPFLNDMQKQRMRSIIDMFKG